MEKIIDLQRIEKRAGDYYRRGTIIVPKQL